MNNFEFCNPTRIFFGKGAVSNLANQIKQYNNILVTYSGGSIKRNGIYDTAMQILKEENKKVFELRWNNAKSKTR
jgi:alcohol dehydrogenase YqhD (iron-dependent ADH family)